jgi:tetratricopeptide (TPR) repeat protein
MMAISRPGRALAGVLLTGLVVCAAAEPVGALGAQADAGSAAVQERLKRVSASVFSGEGIKEAIQELNEILAIDPKSAHGHFLLGLAYRRLGAPETMGEVSAELRQALALDPTLLPARFYLAQAYLEMGRAERARAELQTALGQLPDQPQFLALLGEIERQLKNPRRSVELNRKVLAADEGFAEARYYLALALFDLGQRGEAIRELERVVQSGPKTSDPYLALASAYLEAARVDDGLAVLRQAMQIDPSQPEVRIQLARAFRLKGRLDDAEEQLRLAAPKGVLGASLYQHQKLEFIFYQEQGLVRQQRGRLAEAAESFQKILAMDPNHGPTHRHLAEIYLQQGSYARASEQAARARKLGFPLPEASRKLLEEKLAQKEARPRK